MFFKSFDSLKEIIIMSVLVYFSIIIILRISGKRTLSSLNAFDFVVTVTIGSIGATTILSSDTSFLDGLSAIIALVLLQYIAAKLDANFKFVSKILKSDPTLVYYDGEYLDKNMKKMRITEEDILQQIRVESGTLIENVGAVILESNGKLSVITLTDKKEIENLRKYN
nr:YetF domain-containing protein [Tissierella sp.]